MLWITGSPRVAGFVAGDGWDDFDLEDSKPKVAEMAGATSAQVRTGRDLNHISVELCALLVVIALLWAENF